MCAIRATMQHVPLSTNQLLERAGRHAEAAEEFEEAARRTRNGDERTLLERRAAKARSTT